MSRKHQEITMRHNNGVLTKLRRRSFLSTHFTLALMLQLVAGHGWADELRRAAQTRRALGVPSTLAKIIAWVPRATEAQIWLDSTQRGLTAQASGVFSWLEENLGAQDPQANSGITSTANSSTAASGATSGAAIDHQTAIAPTTVPPLPQPPAGLVPLAPDFGTPPWHLLSVADQPDNVDPAVLLPTVSPDFNLAYAYDACDPVSPWSIHDPVDLAVSDLVAVDHRIGFWLKGTAPDPLAVAGTEPTETSIRLCPGWNLIGYPLAQGRPVLAALASILGKFLRVYDFDPADPVEPWKVFDVDVPSWANTLKIMQRGRGYWIYAIEETNLVFRNTGPPPEVEITSPADGDIITYLTDVVGTVRSDLLESWELAYRLVGESQWTVFATGNVPVLEDFLGVFDPTLLLNGLYEISLEATDFSGQTASTVVEVTVEGRAKIGHLSLTFVDMNIPVAGLSIQVIRTYDSRDRKSGDFGFGWRLGLRDVTVQENRPPGEDWQGTREGQLIPTYCIKPTARHIVTITLADDSVLKFLPTPEPECELAAPPQEVTITYKPLPGTFASLRPLGQGDKALVVGSFPGPVDLWDLQTNRLHDPDSYELTFEDGRVLVIDQEGGLRTVTDQNGNVLTVTRDGILHSSGRDIAFNRDAEDRITEIVDPAGERLTYDYDQAGDLVSFTDAESNSTRFRYNDSHLLEEWEDPRGLLAVRNEFDQSGRLVRQIDALGNVIEYDHDLTCRRQILTDRLGRVRVLDYDRRGNIVRERDQEGAVTTRSFDALDNLLSQTDPLGNIASYTYDEGGRILSAVDALDNTTFYTYSSRGQLLSTTDPLGRVTSREYDDRGNLTSETDPLGQVTRYAYDGAGNLIRYTDALGRVTQQEFDGFGHRVKEIVALGNEETYTYDDAGRPLTLTRQRTTAAGTQTLVWTFAYDRNGRLLSTTTPDGATTVSTFDALSNPIESADALGRVTRFLYDQRGQLREEISPDGTTLRHAYDAEGRRVATTDQANRTTTFTYDGTGRLLATTHADGSSILRAYDLAGRLLAETDALGNETRFVTDAAGRPIEITDPLGQTTRFSYDGRGNRVAMVDAAGRSTTFVYDAADRLIKTVLPDGFETEATYDSLGRQLSRTDPEGRVTSFEYDALGRMIAVTDALGHATRFTFDEAGNRVTETDAAGRVTRFEYDEVGRRTRRVLPGGDAESWSFDLGGSMVRHTDFNGDTTTFTYDPSNLPLTRTLADGSVIGFTYTATGRRASMTDGRGITTYGYDTRDRLTRVAFPDGRELRYTYDANGHRTEMVAQVSADSSLLVRYSHDDLGRLATVTDPQGQVYSHTYDAVGNRTSLTHPNGVVTAYTHDSRNRLVNLTTRGASGDVVQSFAYTLGPSGNRLRVDEHGEVTRQYTYDALYRVTGATQSLAGTPERQATFSYDEVGNRSRRQVLENHATTTTDYTHDGRNRLISDGIDSFGWDANGQLISRQGADPITYTWSPERQLQDLDLADGTRIRHTYDGDGILVRTEVTSPIGPPTVRTYLVDSAGPLSQVLAEFVDDSLTDFYVRGDDLLAVLRPGGDRFFHGDGLGSIRALTDIAGAVTDRYRFAAFGELLEQQGNDPNPFLFAGEQREANSGLYYLRARWLAPDVGRFVSSDPFLGNPFEPLTLHKYTYAHNNPVNMVDPTGLLTALEAGAIAAIGAAIGVVSTLIANHALGRKASALEIVFAGAAGALLGPAAIAYPAFGVGLGVVGVGATTGLVARVFANPDSSFLQKTEAVALLIASIWGTRVAFKYYKSSQPGARASTEPPPPAEATRLPLNVVAPDGLEIVAGQATLDATKVAQIPGLMGSLVKGNFVPPIKYYRTGNRIFINNGRHRMAAALELFKQTGDSKYVLQLINNGKNEGPIPTWFPEHYPLTFF